MRLRVVRDGAYWLEKPDGRVPFGITICTVEWYEILLNEGRFRLFSWTVQTYRVSKRMSYYTDLTRVELGQWLSWIGANVDSTWSLDAMLCDKFMELEISFSFADENDATLFALRWGT